MLEQLHTVSLNPFDSRFYNLSSLAIVGSTTEYLIRSFAIWRQLRFMDSPEYIPPTTQTQIDQASIYRSDDPRRSVTPISLDARILAIKNQLRDTIWHGGVDLLVTGCMVLGGWDKMWRYAERLTLPIMARTGMTRGYLITPLVFGALGSTVAIVTRSATSTLFELSMASRPWDRVTDYFGTLAGWRKPDLHDPWLRTPLKETVTRVGFRYIVSSICSTIVTEIYEKHLGRLERTGWGLGYSVAVVAGLGLLALDSVVLVFHLRNKYEEKRGLFPDSFIDVPGYPEGRLVTLDVFYNSQAAMESSQDGKGTPAGEKNSIAQGTIRTPFLEDELREEARRAVRTIGVLDDVEIWVDLDITRRVVENFDTALPRNEIALSQFRLPRMITKKNGIFLILYESQLLDFSLEENAALIVAGLSHTYKTLWITSLPKLAAQAGLAANLLGPALLHDYYFKHPRSLASVYPGTLGPASSSRYKIPLSLSWRLSSVLLAPTYMLQRQVLAYSQRGIPERGDRACAKLGHARGLKSVYEKRRGTKTHLLSEEKCISDFGTQDSISQSIAGLEPSLTQRIAFLAKYE